MALNKIASVCGTEGTSRRGWFRAGNSVRAVSAIVAIALGWHAWAQTNDSLELGEALDDTNLVWSTSTSGIHPWRAQFAETHDEMDAAEGGPLQAGIIGELNSLTTTVAGPGTLSFWWKLEDTTCFQLSLLVGTNVLASLDPWIPGPTNWEQRVVRIPPGSQNLKWLFATFCGDGSPPGRAWLDEVKYTSEALALAVLSHRNDSLTIEVTGPTGTRVQAEFSTDLIHWAPLPSGQLTLVNGRGALQAPKSDSQAFYRVATRP
jgi:hypothetical protein